MGTGGATEQERRTNNTAISPDQRSTYKQPQHKQYDWRLPLPALEARDAFFSRAKAEIELQRGLAGGVKPVVVSHSYGAVVFTTFLHWAEAQEAGWVDKNVHAYVNLAGTLLGVPKAIAPLLSGARAE